MAKTQHKRMADVHADIVVAVQVRQEVRVVVVTGVVAV